MITDDITSNAIKIVSAQKTRQINKKNTEYSRKFAEIIRNNKVYILIDEFKATLNDIYKNESMPISIEVSDYTQILNKEEQLKTLKLQEILKAQIDKIEEKASDCISMLSLCKEYEEIMSTLHSYGYITDEGVLK